MRELWRRFYSCSVSFPRNLKRETVDLSLPEDVVNSFPFTSTVNKLTISDLLSPVFESGLSRWLFAFCLEHSV